MCPIPCVLSLLAGVLSVVAGALWPSPAIAYPDRPVKVIVQGAAGSGPDVVARIVLDALARRWGQPVVIHNQAGAGGLVAARAAAAAPADGYTLYLPTITTFVILPEMHDALPVDLDKDFTTIGLVAETPMLIAASRTLEVRGLDELIASARRRPGELFFAANNRGSLPHLTGEMFKQHAGIDIAFVPYAGAAAGLQDVAGGRVPIIVESVGALLGAIRGGTVVPLAVASPQRLPSLAHVPTVAETLPGFSAVAWFALLVPRGTPGSVVDRISHQLNDVLALPDVQRALLDVGAVPRSLSPDATAAFIRSEQQRWRPRVRSLGLKSQ